MANRITARNDWSRVRFGDVVRLVRDRVDPETSGLSRFIAGEHMDTDDLRIRRWGEIGDGYLGPAFHMRFKPGHVLYGSRRTYLRKVALADFEGICANTTFVLESADASVLLPELLPYVMQTEPFHDHSIKQSKGSVNPYVNFSDLAWYEFALPPIAEQHKIVAVLDAHLLAMESVRTAHARLNALRYAHLRDYFEPRYLSGAPLTRVASVIAGGTPSKAEKQYWGGVLPWASAKDMKRRRLDDTELHLTDSGWREATVAPPQSTLVVVRGMILAHTFPVAWCSQAMAFNQDLRALVAKDSIIPEYLTMWTEWAAPWFLRRTSESSHGTKRVESDVFNEALMPVAPIDEQRRLVASQSDLLLRRSYLEKRHDSAKRLQKTVLQSLLPKDD